MIPTPTPTGTWTGGLPAISILFPAGSTGASLTMAAQTASGTVMTGTATFDGTHAAATFTLTAGTFFQAGTKYLLSFSGVVGPDSSAIAGTVTVDPATANPVKWYGGLRRRR